MSADDLLTLLQCREKLLAISHGTIDSGNRLKALAALERRIGEACLALARYYPEPAEKGEVCWLVFDQHGSKMYDDRIHVLERVRDMHGPTKLLGQDGFSWNQFQDAVVKETRPGKPISVNLSSGVYHVLVARPSWFA